MSDTYTKTVPPYLNFTPVAMLINELNQHCVKYARAGNMEKAREYAIMSDNVEVALMATHYHLEPYEHRPQ